jgi:signal peptidase I
VATTSGKKSKLREALKNDYIKTSILIIIVVCSLLSFWFGVRAVLGTEYPFMAVATGSMEPTLPVGTIIVVQGVDPSTIYAAPSIKVNGTIVHRGDIVVFWHNTLKPEGWVLEQWVHRAVGEIIENGRRYLVTLGDANHGVTDTHYNITTHERLNGLPEEYVIGKVVATAPYIGQVVLFMQTPNGKIIIIVLVVAILIVEFIPFPRKKEKEQGPEQKQVKA